MNCSEHYRPSLRSLAVELLLNVIEQLEELDSLKSFASVNRTFRQLCAPRIFRTLKINLSTLGLDMLVQISCSGVAPYVKEIFYDIPDSIDPRVEDWDYFRTQVYTPSEYESDLRDLFWTFEGKETSYDSVFAYFRSLSRGQRATQRKDRDMKALVSSLPYFPNLNAIYMSFVDGIESPFRWFAGRVLLDQPAGGHSIAHHLAKCATAMIAAKISGVAIRTFDISGVYARIDSDNAILRRLLGNAFSNIEELRVINSPALLEFLFHVSLPRLCRFELGSCWLSIEDLERFVDAHADTLRFLHLEDVWLINEKVNEQGIYLSLANAGSILEKIGPIRESGIFREVTINRQPGGHYEAREVY